MGNNDNAEEERIDALKLAIRERFPATPTPADEDIARHDCSECLAIRAAFARRTWDSLQPSELEARFDSLPMLSPGAFKYYLPAYLTYSPRTPRPRLPCLPIHDLRNCSRRRR